MNRGPIISVDTTKWKYPDGPWGWNPVDGTSLAPTPGLRQIHVDWYHDYRELHGIDD